VRLLEEEDREKEKISEEYIRNLFTGKSGDSEASMADKERKLELLNEFLSDQFLERMSGLLLKQFTEKEQLLKLLLARYSDQQHSEMDAIKKSFKIQKDGLEAIKAVLPEHLYNEGLKALRLNEENLLRDVDLKI